MGIRAMLGNRFSFAGMITIMSLFQSPYGFPRISDAPGKTQTAIVTVRGGGQEELCVTLPDGIERLSGTDTYRDYATRISAEVFAKNRSDSSWGKACSAIKDSMSCSNAKDTGFLRSIFELDPFDGYNRRICWTFVNHGHETANAKLVAHYTLREVKNGFVLFSRKHNDRTPIATTVQAECVCSSDGQNVTAYFGRELKPSSVFFARRGDIIEIQPMGKGQQLGIPEECVHELAEGKYHVKIGHMYPFDQPAVYKTIVQGKITSEPLSDVSKIFGRPVK
jgi:hypothetical protein